MNRAINETSYERFGRFTKLSKSGCWIWSGSCVRAPLMHLPGTQGRPISVRRFAFEQTIGPIPDKLVLHAKCEILRCVNPYHMKLNRPWDGAIKGRKRMQAQFCMRWHRYNKENTYYHKNGKDKVVRRCRICTLEAHKKKKAEIS